jgi:hypothetical protein
MTGMFCHEFGVHRACVFLPVFIPVLLVMGIIGRAINVNRLRLRAGADRNRH